MAVEPAVIVPALAVGHILGLLMLVYSFEKVYGVIRKTRRHFATRLASCPSEDQVASGVARLPGLSGTNHQDENLSAGCSLHCSFDSIQGKTTAISVQYKQAVRPFSESWIRGCLCRVKLCTSPVNAIEIQHPLERLSQIM
jgi:hypothetical protein